MDSSDEKPKTDEEIQAEMIEFWDNAADEIIARYLKDNPGHDISDHEAFTMVGISNFLQVWHYYKLKIPDELYDKVVKMYMKLIPPDYGFLKTFKDDLIKNQQKSE